MREFIKKLYLKKKKIAGFTLVEILAVLFIVSVGLIGVVSLVIQNIRSQSINKNGIIAYQLAQEGIELIRKTRDTNWRNNDNWDTNLSFGEYYMDYNDASPTAINNLSDGFLYYNTDGFYDHDSSGETTIFQRKIELINLSIPEAVGVKVTVNWGDRDQQFNYTLETILYDWWGI